MVLLYWLTLQNWRIKGKSLKNALILSKVLAWVFLKAQFCIAFKTKAWVRRDGTQVKVADSPAAFFSGRRQLCIMHCEL
jgi:hypothetical protein